MAGEPAMVAETFLGADLGAPRRVDLATGTAVVFTHRNPDLDRVNQDAMAVVSQAAGGDVLVVADGAGGAPGGERASALAIEHTVRAIAALEGTGLPMREGVLRGFEAANQGVLEMGIGAGTTLAVVEIAGNQLRAYHAGDSRILVCGQRGREKLLTASHSPVGYAVQAGILDERAALSDAELHVVSNLVGNPDLRIEVSSLLPLAKHDTVVLGSDGLFDNLAPGEVIELMRAGDLVEAVARAVASARDRMGDPGEGRPSKPDDLTIVAYRRA